MVLSIKEMQKKSYFGNIIRTFLEDDMMRQRIEMEMSAQPWKYSGDGEDGCEVAGFMPDSHEIVRPSVYNTRMRYYNTRPSTRKRLMPNSNDRLDDPYPSTFIYMEPRPEEGQVGTAGFDLRAGTFIAWSDTIQSWHNQPFTSDVVFFNMPHKELSPGEKFVLEYDPNGKRVYYLFSHEGIFLSPNLEMMIDSKSTTGRVGAMSHFAGFSEDGHVITAIQPYCFNLMIEAGKTRLSQAVIRYKGTPYLENEDVINGEQIKFSGDGVSLEKFMTPGGFQMQFDTFASYYRAKRNNEPIDMDAIGTIPCQEYFELIKGNPEIDVDPFILYLLGSYGRISLGNVCGILSKQDGVATGEGTYGNMAGIFQPGYMGSITMEYYGKSCKKIKNRDGAGYVLFDSVDGEVNYDNGYKGYYKDDSGPQLPKMFKQD